MHEMDALNDARSAGPRAPACVAAVSHGSILGGVSSPLSDKIDEHQRRPTRKLEKLKCVVNYRVFLTLENLFLVL